MWIVRMNGNLTNLNQFAHVVINGNRLIGYSSSSETVLYENEDESKLKRARDIIREHIEDRETLCNLEHHFSLYD